MAVNKMSRITLAVFILGYIDVLCRLAAFVMGNGGLLIKLLYLGTLIAANNGQKWARVVWTVWTGFGIMVSIAFLHNTEASLLLILCGIILPVVMLILLWHPKTSEWFDAQQSRG